MILNACFRNFLKTKFSLFLIFKKKFKINRQYHLKSGLLCIFLV